MKKKTNFYYYIATAALLISWLVYGSKAHNLFKETTELTTPGAAYMIRMLEFTNYRGEELSKILIIFFILVSVTNILNLYLYFKFPNKKKTIVAITGTNLILLAVLSFIANIFWLVYVLLFVLSVLVVMTSLYVARLIWGSGTRYDLDDILYKSDSFQTDKEAERKLKNKLQTYNLKETEAIKGDVFEEEGMYYFEIYANKKIVLNNRGEIIIDENK